MKGKKSSTTIVVTGHITVGENLQRRGIATEYLCKEYEEDNETDDHLSLCDCPGLAEIRRRVLVREFLDGLESSVVDMVQLRNGNP